MLTDEQVLDWIMRNIAGVRTKAMHAYKRGDMAAHENLNKELKYWSRAAIVMEEKVKSDDHADV